MTDIARVPSGQSLGASCVAPQHTRDPAEVGTSPGLAAPQHRASAIRAHVGESIADVKARLDLLAVVAGHVTLERRGRHEHWGRCPFHADRTPSFKVDTRTGRYHCFGCGADGDVLDFLATVEGLDKVGAIRRARELAGGTVERRTPPPRPSAIVPDREAEERRELAQETWRQTMTIWPGTEPWRYLTEVRGIGRWDADRVRWHPACRFGAKKAGCIVVPVSDHATGLVVGIWRILPALTGKVAADGPGPDQGQRRPPVLGAGAAARGRRGRRRRAGGGRADRPAGLGRALGRQHGRPGPAAPLPRGADPRRPRRERRRARRTRTRWPPACGPRAGTPRYGARQSARTRTTRCAPGCRRETPDGGRADGFRPLRGP